MNKVLLVCVVGMLLLTSCNRNVGAIFGSRKDKLEVVDPQFDYLSSKAKFRFKDGEKNITATANFRIKKDSLIWISASWLGFEGARVLINTSTVKVMDRLKKHYYEYTFEELSEQYDFDFNFQMIQSVILGNLIEPYKKQRVEKTDEYFSYTASMGMYSFLNFIGTNSMKLEKVQVFDEETKNTISVNYSDFILVDGEIFPNEIVAKIDYEAEKKSDTEIKISYTKLAIEKKPIGFPFSVPGRYERK